MILRVVVLRTQFFVFREEIHSMRIPLLRRPRNLTSAVFGLAIVCATAFAADLPASKPLKVPQLKFEKYKLANGLEVLTYENHKLPLVAVDLWYHVGPVNEKAGRTGFAHLFEHMMFEGSEHVGEKAHIRYVEGAGATDVNGTTDFDRTNYFETMPSNQLASVTQCDVTAWPGVKVEDLEAGIAGAVAGERPHGIFAGRSREAGSGADRDQGCERRPGEEVGLRTGLRAQGSGWGYPP